MPRPLIRFAIAGVASALLIVILGFTTDLRWFAHGTLIGLGAIAFLPFVIIAIGIAIPLIIMFISFCVTFIASFGDSNVDVNVDTVGDTGLVHAGVQMTPHYYRFLFTRFIARRRFPVFWGIPCGLLAGALVLTAYLWIAVIPGEARTAEILLDLQERIDQHYARTSRFPAPKDGQLMLESLDEEAPASQRGPALDGFGRPLVYEKRGHWKVASYLLKSHGHDGISSRDDLCRGDATKLAKFASAIRIEGNNRAASWSAKLGAIGELRCNEE